ncbi:MAG TPA: MFS transporter [Steroidobacteraceae bacterium]|nr:MFS transporter [Steroidobacteraceae bacterium]
MCCGFLGLQFGFALQNANVSRIFQTLGASLDQVPLLWIAAPLTGLVVQPIVGYLSDRTWTRLGRRRPYLLAGAVASSAALVLMPRSPTLWVAAGLLWLLDGSINVSMQPFRAFVGDQLPLEQRAAGYAMQTFFIGVGAVMGSMLPWLLALAGVSNTAAASGAAAVPDTVRYSFDLGAAVMLAAVGWTVFRTREFPPEVLRAFDDASPALPPPPAQGRQRANGALWTLVGLGGLAASYLAGLDRDLYLLFCGVLLWGLGQAAYSYGLSRGPLATLMRDLAAMPLTMRRLAPVQFFSWLALFAMWIYTTAAVAQVHFGAVDPHSEAYNRGANWVGVLFAAYNGFAALAAALIPAMARRFGLRLSHLVNLWAGGAALLSFPLIPTPLWLLVPMLGVGLAWSSILSLPYALLSSSVPADKMGAYMGIFNFFVVLPQLVAATVLGFLLRVLFGGAPVYALILGGLSLLVAGLLVLRVPEPERQHEASRR